MVANCFSNPSLLRIGFLIDKSKFSISPEEMAKVYTALSTEDGYEGFLYDEKCREVKANASAYEEEEQKKLYTLLEQMTSLKNNE